MLDVKAAVDRGCGGSLPGEAGRTPVTLDAMPQKTTVRKSYRGRAETPIEWAGLVRIVEGFWGSDALRLPAYPEVIGGVSANWKDDAGAEHSVNQFDALRGPYENYETALITINGRFKDTYADVVYRPGVPSIEVSVATPSHEMTELAIFDRQKRVSVACKVHIYLVRHQRGPDS